MTIREFLDNLYRLVIKLEIPRNLLKLNSVRQEEYIKGLTVFFDTIDEIFGLIEMEKGGNEKFSLPFFLDQIRIACNRGRFNIKEKSDYGVQVTTLNEIRGLKFDYLFIGGLCDGDFPTKYSPEIFFSGSFRKRELVHITEERYLFYQALCSWEKNLYLSYPAAENEKELLESTFLSDFTKVFDISSVNPKNENEEICSRDELLISIGDYRDSEFGAGSSLITEQLDNQKLGRDIDIHNQKIMHPEKESIYNGSLLVPGEKNGLSEAAEQKLIALYESAFSVSQLETYAKCPFKYLIERVFKLQSIEEPSEEIEPIELGSILHSILFRFFIRMRERNIVLTGCGENEIKTAEKILFEIADDIIVKAGLNFPLAFYERERIFGLEGNRKESILYKVLEFERSKDPAFLPSYFEVSFGGSKDREFDDRLSTDEMINAGNVKLRGKIDRIEINNQHSGFNVVDYKLSGKKPTKDELYNGISLQLPFYLYAADILLKGKFYDNDKIKNEIRNVSPWGMYIYSLKYKSGELGAQKISLSRKSISGEENILMHKELMNSTINYIKKYVENISEGKFFLSKLEDRENQICRFCDFRSICRINEVIDRG